MTIQQTTTSTLEVTGSIPNNIIARALIEEINIQLTQSGNHTKITDVSDLSAYEVFIEVPGGGDWSNCTLEVLTKQGIDQTELKFRAKLTVEN